MMLRLTWRVLRGAQECSPVAKAKAAAAQVQRWKWKIS